MAEMMSANNNRSKATLVKCSVISFDHSSAVNGFTFSSTEVVPKCQKVNVIRPGIASFIVTLSSLVIGCGIGYPSTALPNLNSQKGLHFKVDPFEQSWVGSLYFLGAVPGALMSGWTADTFGRKVTIMFGSLPHVTGWIIVAGSVNVHMIYAGRLITGFCFGLMLTIVGVYISEIAPPKIRGSLMSFHELALNIGILLVYILGTFLNWRWLAIVNAGCLTVLACAIFFMPETPRWLIMHNEKERAMKTLAWIRGDGVDVSEEFLDIEESIKDTKNATPWIDFVKPPLLKCFLVSEFLYVLQELSGINIVRLYTVSIFQAAKTNIDPNLETIIVGLVLVAGSLLFTSVVEKSERRVFLLISSMMMAVSLAGMGAYFQVRKHDEHFAESYLFWLPLLASATICVGYVLGVGPMPYVVTSEVFPNRARGRASGMGVATLCLFGFLITKYFVNISYAVSDAGAFFLCGGICLAGFIVIFFMVPETKGKKLEVIQSQLATK